MPLSAVIITSNEKNNIERCLQSAAWADERIVVDAHSTDGTPATAEALGARVFSRSWPGYGAQKNFGLRQARGPWVLFIDADEEITPELRREIIEALRQPAVDFYWLKIITIFLGRPLRHLYGHNLRLFRKNSGRWTNAKVHEQVTDSRGRTVELKSRDSVVMSSHLLHHSHRTVSSYLQKMHHYTSLDAQQMYRTGRHRSGRPVGPSFALPWRLSLRQFIKLYFYRRGFLDAGAGLIWCVLSAYYEWEMSVKYLRLRARSRPGINVCA